MNIVWKYVDGDSLEDEIILSAISANTKLQEKTKALIRKDWEAENESMLTEAHKKLDSLHAELKSTTEHLIEVQEAFKRTKAEETRLASIIAERETLAEDVEKGVAERIQKARDNAAEFIASMAFVGRQPAHAETSAFESVPSKTDIHTYHVFLAYEKSDELEAHHSWADVMNTAISELAEAGVAKQYRNGLAAFLCAAYIEKQPILLVGPNAIDIAQAFSAALTAQKYGLLCCEGTCTSQLITEIGANDESIVIVNNLLASGWINRLPEIFSKENIFYMATHPYAEDIQVEPQSLYSFMLPVFTEFIVDRKATKKYCGGYFAEDFVPYSAEKTAPQLAGFSRLTLSPLVRSQINRLVNTMQGIYPAITADDKFLFCIFPIAYASMRTNELTEAIAQPQNGTEISASLKRDLRCVLGDI